MSDQRESVTTYKLDTVEVEGTDARDRESHEYRYPSASVDVNNGMGKRCGIVGALHIPCDIEKPADPEALWALRRRVKEYQAAACQRRAEAAAAHPGGTNVNVHGHGARTGGRAVAVQLLRLSDIAGRLGSQDVAPDEHGPDETSLANLNDQGETFGVIAAA